MMKLYVHCDRNGSIVTETEDGAWVRCGPLGIEDDAGDIHENGPDRSVVVADLLSAQSGEHVTAEMVRAAWGAS